MSTIINDNTDAKLNKTGLEEEEMAEVDTKEVSGCKKFFF